MPKEKINNRRNFKPIWGKSLGRQKRLIWCFLIATLLIGFSFCGSICGDENNSDKVKTMAQKYYFKTLRRGVTLNDSSIGVYTDKAMTRIIFVGSRVAWRKYLRMLNKKD